EITSHNRYAGIDFALIDKKPRNPADPSDTAMTCIKPANAAATPEPIKAQKNGNLYFRLTPNNAGSVIPNRADTVAEEDNPFIFLFFVNANTPNVAAP